MDLTLETAIKLLISVLIGGIIGLEREYRNKSAGLRTLILISLGSTLFTLFSMEIGERTSPDRIASNIVNGIGFMGAGVIFTSGMGINGVTTAATIWATAALGMGVAAGHEWVSLFGCLALVLTLHLFTYLEDWIDRVHQVRTYKIECLYTDRVLEHYEGLMKKHKLSFKRGRQLRNGDTISSVWESGGRHDNHSLFIHHVLQDPQVKLFEF